MTRRWAEPLLTDPAVVRDTARFLGLMDKSELLDISTRLGRFAKPVRLIWDQDDQFFKPEMGRQLAATFLHAREIRALCWDRR